jgi:hypothetical protein
MTWLKTSDPLALLAIQAGQVQNPSQQNGAVGGGSLDTDQRAHINWRASADCIC